MSNYRGTETKKSAVGGANKYVENLRASSRERKRHLEPCTRGAPLLSVSTPDRPQHYPQEDPELPSKQPQPRQAEPRQAGSRSVAPNASDSSGAAPTEFYPPNRSASINAFTSIAFDSWITVLLPILRCRTSPLVLDTRVPLRSYSRAEKTKPCTHPYTFL